MSHSPGYLPDTLKEFLNEMFEIFYERMHGPQSLPSPTKKYLIRMYRKNDLPKLARLLDLRAHPDNIELYDPRDLTPYPIERRGEQ